jgi:type 1 glutamine amidotransferase
MAVSSLAILLGLAGDPPSQNAPQTSPIRVLCLLGGEHHLYEKNMTALAAELARVMSIRVQMVRIDRPPDGCPKAEKATIASNPAILADPELRSRFDVILAYHQESYTQLEDREKDGLLTFVRNGGGWVGLHSASDSFKSWDEYIRMVGGRFESHPPFGDISVQRVIGDHPILNGVTDFTLKDEFYHLDSCPLTDKDLLLVGQSPGDQKTRPVAWTRRYGYGRVFYTILGHGTDTFSNPMFVRLISQAIQWVAVKGRGWRDADGYIQLFNGRDLDGWTMTGPGRFVIEDGSLKSEGGLGLLWYSAQTFRNFTLELDWRATRAEDNSGVMVRFETQPETAWDASSKGYEVQICESGDEKSTTGSIFSFAPARKRPGKPVGEWNHMAITVRDQLYAIAVNGQQVCEFTGDRGRFGYVGLQNHDPKSVVRFRNIRIKELQ